MAVATLDPRMVRRVWSPRGAASRLWRARDPEVLLSGPAGTGKSRGVLEYLHHCAHKYPGMRGLMLRKTRTSLTQSALVTFERQVVHPLDRVVFRTTEQEFRYPGGSVVVVGGLDKPTKVMSAEYDLIYVQEATELTEDDWESLTTRLRNGVMPYQQIVADCNPSAPSHWLKKRCESGKTRMLESRHEDNPTITPEYMAKLDALTGVRYLRLRKGLWAAAEGLVYEGWDPARHLLDRLPVPAGVDVDRFGVPRGWPRYWVVDFGFTHPFCWQAWTEDPDGRLYRYREIYRTQRLVEDHAADILALHGASLSNGRLTWTEDAGPKPRAVICDHDAEDRATFTKHTGLTTVAAKKAVRPGIQAVASRLKAAGDGKPRLYFLRDALVARDPRRDDAKRPACTEEEVESYVWDTSNGRKRGEEPVKEDDHGMDCTRYMVAHRDLGGGFASW